MSMSIQKDLSNSARKPSTGSLKKSAKPLQETPVACQAGWSCHQEQKNATNRRQHPMYNLPSTNTPMHLLEKQRAFLSAKATIVGFCGPHACGKTTSLLTAAFEVCGDLEARAMISTLIATMQPQSLFAEAKTLYPHLNLPIEQKAHMRINFASRSFQWPNYQQTPMRVYHSQMRFAMVADALLPQYEGLHFDFVGIDNLE